jgi:hypothetical protein
LVVLTVGENQGKFGRWSLQESTFEWEIHRRYDVLVASPDGSRVVACRRSACFPSAVGLFCAASGTQLGSFRFDCCIQRCAFLPTNDDVIVYSWHDEWGVSMLTVKNLFVKGSEWTQEVEGAWKFAVRQWMPVVLF